MRRTVGIAVASAAATAVMAVGIATPAAAAPEGRGNGPLASLVSAGTITKDDASAIRSALQAARPTTAPEDRRAAGLAALVSAGVITQAQADAISTAGRGGIRDLVADGTLSRADVARIHAALRAQHAANLGAREAATDAVIAGLVSAGTLTQVQADAVDAALDGPVTRPGRGPRG